MKPVVKRFVKSFDEPTSPETISFWQPIAHRTGGGSGPTFYSGWITAFCFWDRHGNHVPSRGANIKYPEHRRCDRSSIYLRLDEAVYHQIESNDVSPGFSSVSVGLDDKGTIFDCLMVAGSVGMRCRSSGEKLAGGERGFDTLAAQAGWWIFEIWSKSSEQAGEGGVL